MPVYPGALNFILAKFERGATNVSGSRDFQGALLSFASAGPASDGQARKDD
jgi:hypothetical protein